MAIVHNTLCAWRLILSWQQKWHRSKMWQCVKSLLAVCCHFQSFSPRVVSLLLFGALWHRRGVAVGEWGLRAGLGCELRRGTVPLQGSDWKSPGESKFHSLCQHAGPMLITTGNSTFHASLQAYKTCCNCPLMYYPRHQQSTIQTVNNTWMNTGK